MSNVVVFPDVIATAATDLTSIGVSLGEANVAAATATAAIVPAAADEVSKGIAHVFAQAGAEFQKLAGEAAAFRDQFVQHLNAGAQSYVAAEAANAAAVADPLAALSGVADFVGDSIGGTVAYLRTVLSTIWSVLTPLIGGLLLLPFILLLSVYADLVLSGYSGHGPR